MIEYELFLKGEILLDNKEIIHTVKRLKKYEELNRVNKEKAEGATIGLVAAIIAIYSSEYAHEIIGFICELAGFVTLPIHIKHLITSLTEKTGYDIKADDLRDSLEENGIYLDEDSKRRR